MKRDVTVVLKVRRFILFCSNFLVKRKRGGGSD